MATNPSTTFFWNDWENEPSLKLCSLAAQGLWMRMLTICARSDKPGYLRVSHVDLDTAMLSTLVGRHVGEIEPLIAELDRFGVFSRDRSGCIYSRRMVRDANRRAASAKGGRKAAALNLRNERGLFDHLDSHPEIDPDDHPDPLSPLAPIPKIETESCTCTESSSEPPSSTSVARRPAKTRGVTPLPPDWQPDLDYAKKLGFHNGAAAAEAEKFRAYWTKGRGSDTRRSPKGWAQTWFNWIAKAAERGLRDAPAPRRMMYP